MSLKNTLKKVRQGIIKTFKAKNVVPVYVQKENNNILNGKTALITGGASGIGFGIAKAFVNAGCKVVIAGRNEIKLKNACSKLGDSCKYITLDVSNVPSMDTKILEASKAFGENGQLDILVNSAGTHGDGHFVNVTEETFDSVINANLKGTYFMCQKIGNYMIKNKIKGHILNISSSSALKPAWTPYEVSKWGVCGITKGAASALIKHGIVVNALGPGPVATEMLGRSEDDTLYMPEVPAKRYAVTEEIGQMAVYMASDFCNLVVGDTLYISGGSGIIKN